MGRDAEREVTDALSVGLQGACCLTGVLTTILSLGFAPLAGLISMTTKAPPVEKQLIANKLPPPKGKAIVEVMCPRCHRPNEEGQIECFACGRSLVVFPEFREDKFSHLQVQWMTLAAMVVIGFLIILTRNPYLGCLGWIVLVAAGIWAFTLIIPTVNSWQR